MKTLMHYSSIRLQNKHIFVVVAIYAFVLTPPAIAYGTILLPTKVAIEKLCPATELDRIMKQTQKEISDILNPGQH